jgi:hypothetical protein
MERSGGGRRFLKEKELALVSEYVSMSGLSTSVLHAFAGWFCTLSKQRKSSTLSSFTTGLIFDRTSAVKLPPNVFFRSDVNLFTPLHASSVSSEDRAPLLRAPSLIWLEEGGLQSPSLDEVIVSNRNGDLGESGFGAQL